MGELRVTEFLTLDGVAQGPGRPDEDRDGGFAHGGWQAPLVDEASGAALFEAARGMDALLLGRRTYEIFAGYWPHHTDSEIGALFDRIPKYVASRSAYEPGWRGSTRIGGDLANEVRALRDRHRDVHVIGSLDLVQTLLAEELYDELGLWIHPVVLGEGKKVFPEGAAPANLRLLAPPLTAGSGAFLVRYAPAGVPTTGVMGPD
jgi:dihydrofolate reductase